MTLDNSNLLIFNVGPVPCCVSSDTVQVVIEPPEHITAIPGSNAFRPGLFSYRGKAVAVYDVRTKFNLPVDQRGKLLITTLDNRLSGFWIDNIDQITTPDQGRWKALPIDCPKELFDALFLIKEQLVFKTTFEALAKAQVNTRAKAFIQTLINKNDKKTALGSKPTTSVVKAANTSFSQDTAAPVITQSTSEAKAAEKKPGQYKPTHTVNQPPHSGNNEFFNKAKTKEHKSPSERATKTSAFVPQSINKKSASNPVKKTSTISSEAQANKVKPALSSSRASAQKYTTDNKNVLKTTHHITDKTESRLVTESKHQQTHQQSSGNFAALSFLILTLLIPAGAYYFYTLPDETTVNIKHSYKTNKRHETTDTIVTDQIPISLTDSTQATYINETETAEANKPVEIAPVEIEPEIKVAPTESDYETNSTTNDEIHQASIKKHQNEIVITINDSEARFNTMQEETKQQPSEIEALEVAQTEEKKTTPVTEVVIEKDIIKKEPVVHSNRVIHIVVKGDTLWHIAKRYIHDPFKYKQLARLSRIQNPDLIYPGNRIIIIIKNGKH